jgi:hypothetical protein
MASNQNTTPGRQSGFMGKFKCIKCKKDTFKTAEALASHQAALDHYPVICPTCKKKFGGENALKRHKEIHKQSSVLQKKPLATSAATSVAATAIRQRIVNQPPAPTVQQPQQQRQQQKQSFGIEGVEYLTRGMSSSKI